MTTTTTIRQLIVQIQTDIYVDYYVGTAESLAVGLLSHAWIDCLWVIEIYMYR